MVGSSAYLSGGSSSSMRIYYFLFIGIFRDVKYVQMADHREN